MDISGRVSISMHPADGAPAPPGEGAEGVGVVFEEAPEPYGGGTERASGHQCKQSGGDGLAENKMDHGDEGQAQEAEDDGHGAKIHLPATECTGTEIRGHPGLYRALPAGGFRVS